MNPSKFKHRISFFDSVEIEDNDGFISVQNVEVSKAWAMIKTLQGREFQAADTTKNENTVRFVIRYYAAKNVHEDMSIKYRDKQYQIETILHDDELMKTITIVAKESVIIP